MFFAWFCNMAMHIGMADMTILRYARKWQYGFLSVFGMYLGHFVAWIASGILCAAALGEIAPGPIAYLGAGASGAIAVVVAGWTTANPAAGAVTTFAAIFPALMMRLLDFVALYGLILMPMGAVIFADFWLLPKLGLAQYHAERAHLLFSWPTAITWVGTLGLCYFLPMEIFFMGLPGWFIAVGLYVPLAFAQQRRLAGTLAGEGA